MGSILDIHTNKRKATMIMPDETVNIHTPLNRTQATWVAAWLKEVKNKPVRGGWLGVYQMSVSDIVKKFHVTAEEVISAARGEERR